MRNAWTLLILALLLTGCFDGESSTDDETSDNTGSNNAPTISGFPQPAITINDFYSFSPNTSDVDGDQLSFGIQNKPLWADFNESTGELTGQPQIADVGIHGDIQIEVSDGVSESQLKSFSIQVVQTALGSTTLSWRAPTENEDGTPLTDLSGYKLYYGYGPRDYTYEIDIDNSGLTTYVVEHLVPGTYHFAATAYNASGIESLYSGEAIRSVNQ